jgi:hypothetical protein
MAELWNAESVPRYSLTRYHSRISSLPEIFPNFNHEGNVGPLSVPRRVNRIDPDLISRAMEQSADDARERAGPRSVQSVGPQKPRIG